MKYKVYHNDIEVTAQDVAKILDANIGKYQFVLYPSGLLRLRVSKSGKYSFYPLDESFIVKEDINDDLKHCFTCRYKHNSIWKHEPCVTCWPQPNFPYYEKDDLELQINKLKEGNLLKAEAIEEIYIPEIIKLKDLLSAVLTYQPTGHENISIGSILVDRIRFAIREH